MGSIWQQTVDTFIQDQESPVLQYYLMNGIDRTATLSSTFARDSFTINLNTGHGFTTDHTIAIFEGGRVYQSGIISVIGDVVTARKRSDFNFSTDSIIVKGTTNLAVDGSITIQEFDFCITEFNEPLDISNIVVYLVHSSEADDITIDYTGETSADVVDGTANGQMLFWADSEWVNTETNELVWDDVNKRLGIGVAVPTATLDISGNGKLSGYLAQQGIFGEIHCHDANTPQAIATGATYTKITAFTDNGLSSNVTTDVANDRIVFTKTGIYRVTGSFNFSSGTVNVNYKGSPFLNGVEQNNIHFKRKISTAGDLGSASFTGFIDVTTAGWALDVRFAHDSGSSVNITIQYANLNVSYLGET